MIIFGLDLFGGSWVWSVYRCMCNTMELSSYSYLDELSVAGECAAEYLALYQKLIKPAHWKVYLAARGVLPYIGNLITKVTNLR